MSEPDRPAWAIRLEFERNTRSWGKWDMARRLFGASGITNPETARVKALARQITRWEAGEHCPRVWAVAIADLFRIAPDELFPPTQGKSPHSDGRHSKTNDDSERMSETLPPMPTVELARRLRLSDIDRTTLESLAAVTESLCTQYAYRSPDELRVEAQRWFAYVAQLLEQRVGLYEHRELLVTAGWLALLIGCVEYDSGLASSAEGTRRVALQLGDEAGHSEITAWALEMAAWFAHTHRDPVHTVDYAQAGQRAAGSATVAVQLVAHEARALARMGDVRGVHEALERGHTLLSRMRRPSNPRNHFVVDPSKFDFYAMDAYRVVGEDDRAASHAAEVLRSGRGPDGEDLAPMRMAEARLTLATVAARSGDLEEAAGRGAAALGAARKCLPSLILVADELRDEMRGRYPSDQPTREFTERLQEMRRRVEG